MQLITRAAGSVVDNAPSCHHVHVKAMIPVSYSQPTTERGGFLRQPHPTRYEIPPMGNFGLSIPHWSGQTFLGTALQSETLPSSPLLLFPRYQACSVV